MTLAGAPIRPDQHYRVTVNDYLAAGGDGFATLAHGRDPLVGVRDIEALEAYLRRRHAAAARTAPATAAQRRVTAWADDGRPACANAAP